MRHGYLFYIIIFLCLAGFAMVAASAIDIKQKELDIYEYRQYKK